MKFNISHKAMLFLLCVTTVACNKNGVQREPDTDGNSPIVLTVGGAGMDTPATKAVITDGTNKTLSDFQANTSIFLLIKSDYSSLPESYSYLNYSGSHDTKYTTTKGYIGSDNKIKFSDEGTVRSRYWEDAHARSSSLSFWAFACDGIDYLGGEGTKLYETSNIFYNSDAAYVTTAKSNVPSNKPWQTALINAKLICWNVPHGASSAQTEETLKNRDLLFSNNIAYYGTGVDDHRLTFDTSNKHFKEGKLIFYHALSKITINIKKGEGFNGTNDFRFASGENIKLSYFNIWGQFDAAEGEFRSCNTTHESIQKIYNQTGDTPSTTAPAYVLKALVLPYLSGDTKTDRKGSQFKESTDDVMMEFTIDNNTYRISSGDLYTALHGKTGATEKTDDGNYIPMEAGKNYVFTFTVSKTKIDNITATVADWENVEADEQEPSNARIKLKVEERGTALTETDKFSLYRAGRTVTPATIDWDNFVDYDWKTGYNTTAEVPEYDASPSPHWTTNWYWESNKHYYHFRVLSLDNGTKKLPAPGTGSTIQGDLENGDYYGNFLSSAENTEVYNDILWGAPFMDNSDNEDPDSFKFEYDLANGFDVTREGNIRQIYPAIGPTKNSIKLIMFHMMSDVTINLTTTTGADKVNLSGATVKIMNYYTSARLRLGSGRVHTGYTGQAKISDISIANQSYTDQAGDIPAKGVYHCGIVPQSLASVKLKITTSDNNEYIVDLSSVKASTPPTSVNLKNPYSQGTDSKWIIDKLHPGYKYTYNFKLTKSGIDNITATVVAWETVTVDEEEIKIQ